MIHAQSFSITDHGAARRTNEDTILIDKEAGLYIVCDGMGRGLPGKTASQTAARAVQRFLHERLPELRSLAEAERGTAASALVKDAVQAACAELFSLGSKQPEYAGIGTTLTMLLIDGTRGVMGHVGNSRLYLARAGTVHQLSKDHSLVGELVQANEITPEAALSHPFANVLTRAIGKEPSVLVDTLLFDLLPRDTFLLCTNGVWQAFPRCEDLAPLLQEGSLESSAAAVQEQAKRSKRGEDLSAVFVSLQEGESIVPTERSRQKLVSLQIATLKQVYLFDALPLEAIFKVVDISRIYDCKGGELLIREGERGSSLYIILDGGVVVKRGGTEIARFGPGNHFGEMALLSAAERSASVQAVDDSRLLVIDQDAFRRLVTQAPDLGVSLLWKLGAALSERLNETTKQV